MNVWAYITRDCGEFRPPLHLNFFLPKLWIFCVPRTAELRIILFIFPLPRRAAYRILAACNPEF